MKKILITPYEDRGRFCLHGAYMNAVLCAGGLPFVLPMTEDEETLNRYLEMADGVILSGGGDVEPALYGEERTEKCGEAEPLRDAMEFKLCRMVLERDVPVLGICRGHQVMNCVLGGTLYQHVENAQIHDQNDRAGEAVHQVRIEKNSLLYRILQKEETGVNSRHHQGVKRLAEGLVPVAYAEDGLIEAFELPGKRFCLGVQWHPETMYKNFEDARKVLAAFMAAVEEKK